MSPGLLGSSAENFGSSQKQISQIVEHDFERALNIGCNALSDTVQ